MASQAEEAATAVTAAYIARQRLLTLTLTRDLVVLVRALFTPDRPGPAWAATKTQLHTLIRDRHRIAADLAARYYVDLRAAAVEPARARRVRPAATTELPAVEWPTARQVVETVAREDGRRIREPESTAELEQDLDLDELLEEDAWAELDRIAGVRETGLDEDRIEANLNATGIASFQRALRAGQPEPRAVDTMAVNLAGSATTLVLEGGREVVRAAAESDDEAIGWIRVLDADPCSWCAMLASRGAVYKSAETAGKAKDSRFAGAGQFKWHDHCGCTAVPVFSPDDPMLERADDLYEQWLRETQGQSGKNAINAWRRYWKNRDTDQPNPEGEAADG